MLLLLLLHETEVIASVTLVAASAWQVIDCIIDSGCCCCCGKSLHHWHLLPLLPARPVPDHTMCSVGRWPESSGMCSRSFSLGQMSCPDEFTDYPDLLPASQVTRFNILGRNRTKHMHRSMQSHSTVGYHVFVDTSLVSSLHGHWNLIWCLSIVQRRGQGQTSVFMGSPASGDNSADNNADVIIMV